MADIRAHVVGGRVVDRPAGPARQRDGRHDLPRADVSNRGGAVLPDRLAEVERIQARGTRAVPVDAGVV